MIKKKVLPNRLNKTTTSKNNRPLSKKPGTIIFASYPEKIINKKYINFFWIKYFTGITKLKVAKRKDISYISNYNPDVKIIPLSPTTTVTVRKCSNYVGENYIKTGSFFKKKIETIKLKHSNILLSDIIDYKKINNTYYIMERIIPSISIFDLKKYIENKTNQNRFQASFLKKIKNIDLNNFYTKVEKAYLELEKTLEKIHSLTNKDIDYSRQNVIIMDYNPKTNKFKFGLIDFIGQKSKSF